MLEVVMMMMMRQGEEWEGEISFFRYVYILYLVN